MGRPPSSPSLNAVGGLHDRSSSLSQPPPTRTRSPNGDVGENDTNINDNNTNIRNSTISTGTGHNFRLSANIFGDEFSLEPFGGQLSPGGSTVSSDRTSLNNRSSSEGVRPTHKSPFGDSSEILPPEDEPATTTPTPTTPTPRKSALAMAMTAASSTTKDSSVARAPSSASTVEGVASVAQRSISTSSRFSIPRAMSPYRGQTGPSHPYTMYPQGTSVARSSSISSSTSTVRPAERTQAGVPPPQHPYTMYHQNTVPEEAVVEPQPPSNSAIPLGFPRSSTTIFPSSSAHSPDEVGDIIGPDGHTEQLPPYTLYPDGLPPKPGFPEPLTLPPPRPINDSGTQSPESRISSQELILEQSPDAVESQNEPTEDPESTGSLKEKLAKKGQRRVCCGLPIWMFLLAGAVLLLGTVIGGVIGGVLGSHKGESEVAHESGTEAPSEAKATVTVTASAVLDATPLPSDVGPLDPAPTGDYIMPSIMLADQSNTCVNDTQYIYAWQCLSPGSFGYTIGKLGQSTTIAMDTFVVNGAFIYGAQRPVFSKTNYTLRPMQDKTNMTLGPALFFFTPFDKLVIIAEQNFPEYDDKRSVDEAELLRRASSPAAGTVAMAGHKPWFCWWNSTFLEAFIYVNEPSSSAPNATGLPSATTPYPATPSGMQQKSNLGDGDANDRRKLYPRYVKIEEKRFANGEPAYCEQLQVMDDGTLSRPLHDSPISIREVGTANGPEVSNPLPNITSKRATSDTPGKNCFCRWFNS